MSYKEDAVVIKDVTGAAIAIVVAIVTVKYLAVFKLAMSAVVVDVVFL